MNQNIILFGATGSTGQRVMEQALRDGHHVTAIARNPASIALMHERLHIVQGDVLQPQTFNEAMIGKDIVVSCLGVQSREPTNVYSQGVTNIIQVMNEHGVKRIICLSAGAVIVPPKGSMMTRFFIKNVLQKIFSNLYADMVRMEQILSSTQLDYTIIRAPWLRDSAATWKYRTAINAPLNRPSKISRTDLANYIVRHLTDEKIYKAMVEISY